MHKRKLEYRLIKKIRVQLTLEDKEDILVEALLDLQPDEMVEQMEMIEVCFLEGLQWVTYRLQPGDSGTDEYLLPVRLQQEGMTGDNDEGAAVRSSPLETFPPRLTMMVTFTDRLTGASTDGSGTMESSRGKKIRVCPRRNPERRCCFYVIMEGLRD